MAGSVIGGSHTHQAAAIEGDGFVQQLISLGCELCGL
jgi:hypothetical protein